MQFNVDPNTPPPENDNNNNSGNNGSNFNNMGPGDRLIITEPCDRIRARGREGLAGNWFKASFVWFIYTALTGIPSGLIDSLFGKLVEIDLGRDLNLGQEFYGMVYKAYSSPMSSVYELLVAGALTFGITLVFMNLFRTRKANGFDMFKGFENFIRATGLMLYMMLFVILWCLIPIAGIILGPIAAIRYSQAFYILIDHPEYPIPICVNESKRLMMGNKGKYFILQLSFLGWAILASIPAALISSYMVDNSIFYISDKMQPVISSIILTISMLPAYPVMAYYESTNVGFYEMLTGKVPAEVYIPGRY